MRPQTVFEWLEPAKGGTGIWKVGFALFLLGILLLAPALLMAQAFWNVMLSFPFPHSLNPLVFLFSISLTGALIAALPFGVLFGVVSTPHQWRIAVLFAAIPAASIFCFSAWVNELHSPLHWWLRTSDALFFTVLFPLFSGLGARVGSSGDSELRMRLASGMFALFAVLYYFGPELYFRYFYEGPRLARWKGRALTSVREAIEKRSNYDWRDHLLWVGRFTCFIPRPSPLIPAFHIFG